MKCTGVCNQGRACDCAPVELQQYDVERELPWFPAACLLTVLLGAFGPPLVDWIKSIF